MPLRSISWAVALCAVAFHVGVRASDGADAADVRVEAGQRLETVTVTARRADEDVREVPFSVHVMSGQELEERRLLSVQEALWQIPGVEMNDNGGDSWNALVRIRGVGALQKVSSEDTSVALNVDGVPLLIGNISSLGFDLERIEVLKGPQGTLFGSNSEAGAINVITAKPTRSFEGYVRGEIGTDQQRMAEGAISGPLGETVSARLAVRGVGSDHWVNDYQTGRPISQPRDTGVRGTLLWQPQAATQLTLSAQHDSLRGHPNLYVLRPYGSQPAMDRGTMPWRGDSRTVDRVSAVLEHDFGRFLLNSVTSYSQADTWMANIPYEGRLFQQLLGMAPDNGGYFVMDYDEESLSQEVRLSSKPGDAVFWVAGVNWQRNDRHTDGPFGAFDAFNTSSTVNADTLRHIQSSSRGVFGEVTVPVAERLKLTGGLRHTWDRKSFRASWQAVAGNPSPWRYTESSHSLRDNYTTGRMALSYALSAQTNLYAVASRGYKSGGYSEYGSNVTMGLQELPYDPARVSSYEIGFKNESADGRLGLNGAVFYSHNKGDHISVWDTVTFASYAENLDTRSQGAELSGFWKPGAGLTLGGGLALTDAEITGVPAGSTSGAVAGNRVPDSPRWSANLSLAHHLPLQSFWGWQSPSLHTQINARYVGDREADPQNSFTMHSYHHIDFRMGVSGGNTELYFWIKNLTDKQYDQYGFYYPAMYEGGSDASLGLPSRGRTLGVGFAYYF